MFQLKNFDSNVTLGEWADISKIAKPQLKKSSGESKNEKVNYHYSPLYRWANEISGKDPTKDSAFYYLEPDEMLFNKERHGPPAGLEHFINLDKERV